MTAALQSSTFEVELVAAVDDARAHAQRVRHQLDLAQLRAQDRRVLERIASEHWVNAIPVSMASTQRPPAPLRPYRRRPVVVVRRPWLFGPRWLVFDQHGARARFVCLDHTVALAVARALTDEVREEWAAWTE